MISYKRKWGQMSSKNIYRGSRSKRFLCTFLKDIFPNTSGEVMSWEFKYPINKPQDLKPLSCSWLALCELLTSVVHLASPLETVKAGLCGWVRPSRVRALPQVKNGFDNGVKKKKSKYPRYPLQSACYYFIRLISGCLTPPSFSPSRPSVAESLISAKTMACLSCSTE